MGKFKNRHEISTIGAGSSISFTGTSASAQLLASPRKAGPATFLLCATEDVCILQGGSTVTALTTSFRLPKNVVIRITVNKDENSYIAAITPSGGTDGTLNYCQNDEEVP